MARTSPFRIACAILLLAAPALAQRQLQPPRPNRLGWPEVFEPTRLLHLGLTMAPADWLTVQTDTSFSIEVPGWFALSGEAPILVSVRRKSCDALNAGTGFQKVSLKIDVNEYVAGQEWHDLKKLSLENGDDEDVVTEGLAWALHRMATAPEGYSYEAGLANWATLTINGVYTGVYVNAEQRDKRFLENRGMWIDNLTWLYKLGDIYSDVLKAGTGDSLTYLTLCYDPFQRPSGGCSTPPPPAFESEVRALIDLQGMLTLGAVNALVSHPDSLFSKGKNIHFADFAFGSKRLYFPWDLDSVMNNLSWDIYNPGKHYADHLLGAPAIRAEYRQVFTDLLDGPLAEPGIHAFLDAVEPILTPWLELDPNNRIGTGAAIGGHFQAKKTWLGQRIPIVRAQIASG
ncbi:MAG: CotH kinase family protein [Planctomycetes bacterium]|nr:CotH kinase family protein [Planctomycetota bacterium]